MATQKYLESLQTNDIILPMAYALVNNLYNKDTDEMPELNDPIAFLAATAKGDPDTMYYHQAVKQEDSLQFKQAMQLEIDAHTTNNYWDVIPQEEVPKDHKVLNLVWVMKRKQRIMSREVYKWKARLNVHGGQQEYGINFWDTFAPVVTWMSIRLVLILSILWVWHSRQVHFVLAFPQALMKCPIYMEIPMGVKLDGSSPKTHVLSLKCNLYGQKQAGRVWNKYLHDELININFI
jgi:hypothetical protein